MKLLFRVNPLYVFLHAINGPQKEEPFEGWREFTNAIWEHSPQLFYFLSGQPEYCLYPGAARGISSARKAEKLLAQLRTSREFRRLLRDTKRYSRSIRQQVSKNRAAFTVLEHLIGFTLPARTITVYVTHPRLRNGMAIDDNTIVWGHTEEYANYSTVFICHELMHILTQHDESDVTHAAIELLADNEIRLRLNGRGDYFEYPGHAHLRGIARKLLPRWRMYLRSPQRNFLRFVSEQKKNGMGA